MYNNLFTSLDTTKQKQLLIDFSNKIEHMQADMFDIGFRVGTKITYDLFIEKENNNLSNADTSD